MTAAAEAFVDFKVLILLFINYSPTSKKNSNYKETLNALKILLSGNSARQNFQTYKTHFSSRTVGTFFSISPPQSDPNTRSWYLHLWQAGGQASSTSLRAHTRIPSAPGIC